MPAYPRRRLPFRLNALLLFVLLVTLWLAGGASRGDALGQVVVRGGAWVLLAATILFGERASFTREKPVLLLLLAALLIALLQLVPLPPGVWRALPGREALVQASVVAGEAQPWRPWAIVPGAAVNAASSLIAPFVIFLLVAGLKEEERSWLPGVLLGFVVASTLVGLLQFSGARLDNPFVNGTVGHVSGTFANRNHFALFVAMGCLLAPVWAFLGGRRPGWRGTVALGLVLLFSLTILAGGSRAGVLVGVLALGIGLLLVRRELRREFRHAPRWVFPASVLAMVGAVAVLVLVGIAAGRAESIDRVFTLDVGDDMRSRGLPTVLAMIGEYFPAGSGLGGFDPIFRSHEPFDLLKPTYFNHAHNDFLEVVLDAGLPGLLILAAALLWWVWASARAWRAGAGARHLPPRLGSAMLLLVIIASAFDYPARTPMIMAMTIIAGIWLCARPDERGASALPVSDQHL